MSEDFALRVHTDSALHGLTRNPWNPTTAAVPEVVVAILIAAGWTP